LFTGLSREPYGVPIRYPVACHPQAWAAGSVPFLLETLLGLVPEAFDHRLRVVRPILPPTLGRVDLLGLRVGDARADLAFLPRDHGPVDVRVLRADPGLEVQVEPGEALHRAEPPSGA